MLFSGGKPKSQFRITELWQENNNYVIDFPVA
jgi:hypothetical protein